MEGKELELYNISTNARDFFEKVYNVNEMKTFFNAARGKFNIDDKYSYEDVKYLLYEYEEIKKFAIKNFSDNASVMAAINLNNAETEYYKYINEIYG